MKKIFTFCFVASFCAALSAQIPDGYYDSAKGLTERELKTALRDIIYPHTNVGYAGLYNVYKESDVRADGSIWDMYSNCTFDPDRDRCGNYNAICDCYNREHTIPQSWFNERNPMVADAFHVYPTDGKVNGIRSNYPHGQTDEGAVGGAGLGKLGESTYEGYTGTVFEPDDEYKGDFARTYFYFVTCYEKQLSSMDGDVLTKEAYPGLENWFLNLMLEWHRADPVSAKELARQEAVFKFQNNRNPFIDYPELAEHIWGDKTSTKWGKPVDVETAVTHALSIITRDHEFAFESNSAQSIDYTIYSISGVQLRSGRTQRMQPVSTADMPKGVYLVRTISATIQQTFKLIVK